MRGIEPRHRPAIGRLLEGIDRQALPRRLAGVHAPAHREALRFESPLPEDIAPTLQGASKPFTAAPGAA